MDKVLNPEKLVGALTVIVIALLIFFLFSVVGIDLSGDSLPSARADTLTSSETATEGSGTATNVPWYFQGYDPINRSRSPWADKQYGSGSCGSTYASSGCAPTSLAMAVSYLTGAIHKPDEIGNYIVSQDLYPCGRGTSWDAPVKVAEHYDLQAKKIANRKTEIDGYLNNGALVIQLHHEDVFTRGGHFILLVGTRSDGKYNVHDPNGGNYPGTKVATLSEILGGTNLMSWAIWK